MRVLKYFCLGNQLSVIGDQTILNRLPITGYRLPILTLVLFLWICNAQSQQLPLYTQYMINDYILNPAVGGKMPYYEAKSTSRYQWVGIEDAPRTYILSFNGPLKSKHVGLGGYLFSDVTGPTRRTGFYASYSYHIKLNETMKLSLGLSGGLLQYAVDGSKITLHDPGVDVALNNSLQAMLMPDFGFGAYFYDTNNKYYFGVSAPQLLQNRVKLYDASTSTFNKLTTHVYVTGGYKFNASDAFEIEPSTLLKISQASSAQIDLGVRAIYQKQIWLGAYFRTKDAASALVGYTFKDYLSIGYSHDFTITNIRKYSSGSNEILVGIKFK